MENHTSTGCSISPRTLVWLTLHLAVPLSAQFFLYTSARNPKSDSLQKWLSNWARWGNIPNLSQPNPSPRADVLCLNLSLHENTATEHEMFLCFRLFSMQKRAESIAAESRMQQSRRQDLSYPQQENSSPLSDPRVCDTDIVKARNAIELRLDCSGWIEPSVLHIFDS